MAKGGNTLWIFHWAQELMNNFYINNLSKMPVESPHYLNSASNPHKY